MKKLYAILLALTMMIAATACEGGESSAKDNNSATNSKTESSVTDTAASNAGDDAQSGADTPDDRIGVYEGKGGLSLYDEEQMEPYQGNIQDIAMGFDGVCLTKDGKVFKLPVLSSDTITPVDAANGVRFVDCVGYGVVVEREDGTCLYFDDSFDEISLHAEGFKMSDGSYFEHVDQMEYIVNDGEKLVGYCYDDSELIASEIPVVFEPYSMSGEIGEIGTATDWYSFDYSTFLLMDSMNQVWCPWSSFGVMQMDYDEDENCIAITVYDDPEFGDCARLCFEPGHDEIVIAKASDTANLYLLTEGDEGYEETLTIALPDGMTTADIKEFVKNSDDGLFVTNANEIYSLAIDDDTYEITAQPELSEMLQAGQIVEIMGDGMSTLFLMDDGCVYEKSFF